MADSKKYNGSTWEHSLRKLTTSTDTITTLPTDVFADGNNATVGLVGNMSQAGTPTPSSPIQPQETGERTGNLYLKKIANATINADGSITSNNSFDCYLAKVEADKQYIGTGFVYSFFVNEPFIGSGGSYDGQRVVAQALDGFTSPIDGYVAVRHNTGATGAMLNLGSTPLPYEPYGYKIPISSASTTTPVYLGEVESTRKIKKLVLTGQETWTKFVVTERISFYTNVPDGTGKTGLSSHFRYGATASFPDLASFAYNGDSNKNMIFRMSDDTSITEVADFKAWLAAQYANGTPVTVWYVLATEETAVVNEPLRKIGNYADTVSGISIPTISGADSFDVLTTLKPSEVSLAYTGWHDATVEEWDGSQWQ